MKQIIKREVKGNDVVYSVECLSFALKKVQKYTATGCEECQRRVIAEILKREFGPTKVKTEEACKRGLQLEKEIEWEIH